MKKVLVILAVFLVAVLLSAQGQKETKKQSADNSKKTTVQQNEGGKKMPKKLVAYFSASGTTARAAKELAEAAKAELYEIRPETKYTSNDLDWRDKSSRSSVEMADKKSRPKLADKNAKIADYDVIFIGFPIWWYVAPHIINTFLEAYDFSGKKVVVFATSGGSGFGNTVKELQPSAPKAQIIEGKLLNGRIDKTELSKWAEQF
jgi:flavodoxin